MTPHTTALSQQPPDDLEGLGEEIAELALHISAATYRLLVLLHEFDEREGWHLQGFRSCAAWLAWRAAMDHGAAREKVRVARALVDLPLLSEAMRTGRLSYSKVRALTRVATPANERELLHFAEAGTAAHVERLVRAWRSVDRAEALENEQRRRAERYLRIHTDEHGMVVVSARLDPETGAALMKALEAAEEVLFDQARGAQEQTSSEQRRADAIGHVAESALANGLDQGTRGDRYQVIVHVDATPDHEHPTATLNGTGVSSETSQRLSCDAARVVMHHDQNGSVLSVGRKTRIIPPAIRRALEHRDTTCRFPGCTVTFCEAHHIHHWAAGGETKLANLTRLCRFHHTAVHEGGYRVEAAEDGELRFYRPDGRRLEDSPPPREVLRDPVIELSLSNAIGSAIGAPMAAPCDSCDYNGAIQYYRSLDRGRDVSAET